jgi:hypothetical protein
VVIYRADMGAWNASRQATFGRRTASQNRPVQLQFERLRAQLQSQVPPGDTIYLDLPNDSSGLWRQRLVEFAAMSRLYLAADRARADYVITLTSDPSAPEGLRLLAQAAR